VALLVDQAAMASISASDVHARPRRDPEVSGALEEEAQLLCGMVAAALRHRILPAAQTVVGAHQHGTDHTRNSRVKPTRNRRSFGKPAALRATIMSSWGSP
jgi:hypothetical protein